MLQEKQKYAVLECKKVNKAKTTSLKLFDQKDERQNTFDRARMHDNKNSLQINKSHQQVGGFQYLGGANTFLSQEKSFQEIMNQTRKILALKSKIQEQQKVIERQKPMKNQQKKGKKQSKQQKKERHKINKAKTKQTKQKEITITELDIQRFSTQHQTIQRIHQKIKFKLQNISQKCNIISPLLLSIQSQSSKQGQGNSASRKVSSKQSQEQAKLPHASLNQLQRLQVQIQLMKKNASQKAQSKDILTPWEIQQFSKWQVQSRINGRQINGSEIQQIPVDILKYVDNENQQFYAGILQNQLKKMEKVLFPDIQVQNKNSQSQDQNAYDQNDESDQIAQ